MSDQYEENITKLLDAKYGKVGRLVYKHWNMVAPLFYYGPKGCGCLTQVKRDPQFYKSEELGDLFPKLMADDRIASSELEIVSKEMGDWNYPLNPNQKAQLRLVLKPYAEYQRLIHGTKDHDTIRFITGGPTLSYAMMESEAAQDPCFQDI